MSVVLALTLMPSTDPLTGNARPNPNGQRPPDTAQNGSLENGPATETEGPTSFDVRKAPQPFSQAGAVDPETYLLGPGDLLQLDLWGRLVRTVALEVSPEGKIFLPGLGPIEVSGHSLAWARNRAKITVAQTFRGVSCDLRLERLRVFKVYVSGEVVQSGAVEVTSVTRASEVLARAGLKDDASRRNIEIHHLDGSILRADLNLFERTGRQDFDPFLFDGDVLVVRVAREWVSANGAFARPGRFELAPDDSLSTLLHLAGGLIPSAVPSHTLLVRFSAPAVRETIPIDLNLVLQGGADRPLRDGDALFVYFVPDYHVLPAVEIIGEVLRPGSYPITIGHDRLTDLVEWAGGFSARANKNSIYLLRRPENAKDEDPELDRLSRLTREQMTESEYITFQTGIAEKRNSFRIDWERVTSGKQDGNLDLLLRSGDMVRVEPLVTSVRIGGQVRNPGLVEFVPGRTIDEYIKLAGGFSGREAYGAMRVTRSLTGQVVPANNIKEVEPGDFIWVPERRDVDPWAIFRDVLTIAAQVAVIYVAFRH
jgi:polysaccharide biosynthesis/export protein